MTHDEERRVAWDRYVTAALGRIPYPQEEESTETLAEWAADMADDLLAERDKRWPQEQQLRDSHVTYAEAYARSKAD